MERTTYKYKGVEFDIMMTYCCEDDDPTIGGTDLEYVIEFGRKYPEANVYERDEGEGYIYAILTTKPLPDDITVEELHDYYNNMEEE